MSADLNFIFIWWVLFLAIGLFFLPITAKVFSQFIDRGYIFAKILGMAVLSYLVFLLGTLRILPFTVQNVWIILIFLAICNLIFLRFAKFEKPLTFSKGNFIINFPKRSLMIIFLEELLFALGIFFWAWVRGHEPSIHGLEKFMDFGFINSLLRADYFPPKDMWLPPLSINYYYFGHLVTAVLTKLSGIDSAVTYNLMLATLLGFTFVGAFSLGLNLFAHFTTKRRGEPAAGDARETTRREVPRSRFSLDPAKRGVSEVAEGDRRTLALEKLSERHPSSTWSIGPLICGFLSAFLATLAGNLHPLYAFLKGVDNYWYPDATRFIPYTIHEFPIYSFVVADLHGHLLDVSFVLLTIALLFSILLKCCMQHSDELKTQNSKLKITAQNLKLFNLSLPPLHFELCTLSFLLAVMYMTNAWDGLIYFILTVFILLCLNLKVVSSPYQAEAQSSNVKTQSYNLKLKVFSFKFQFCALRFALCALFLALGFFLFALPFSRSFEPFVTGIGIVGGWEIAKTLGFIKEGSAQLIHFGPFILEKGNNVRSPLWMLTVLWGFFYFLVFSFLLFLRKQKGNFGFRNLAPTDIFVLLLIAISTLLLIFPEMAYIKDIYPMHYRANTMFKLGYQAFIMLSVSGAYIIWRILTSRRDKFFYWFALTFTALFAFVAVYPYFAVNSYYNGLKNYEGVDGLKWLERFYPQDYQAILWLRENIQGQPVILEANGESYTDFARVSANTGLPTVIGWPVHEWLWRGSYDEAGKRIAEVQRMYESTDLLETRGLLEKYNVEYVFVGALEKQKYPEGDFAKWEKLGTLVFQTDQTQVFKILP